METNQRPFPLKFLLFFCALSICALFYLFHHQGSEAVFAQDTPAYQLQGMHTFLNQSFQHLWYNWYWLGTRYGPISPDQNAFILRWVDFPWSLDLLFTVNLLLGGIGFFVMLHRLKLNPPACLFGATAFLLTSSNLTLVFPGHANKIMTSAWIPFAVGFFFTALRDRRPMDYILSGTFLGLALLGGEVQIPYYAGLWFTVWVIFYLIQKGRAKTLTPVDLYTHSIGLFLLGLTALVAGCSTTLHSLKFLGENTIPSSATDPAQIWNFATQFYFPPEEVLSFLTTIQFFGAPFAYWGRDGSPTPLRLSDDYMGLLPLGFAFVGAVALWRLWQVRLFILMAILSLLASFGREGIVFWFLYQLPTMKSQRNPHRWIYFVSFAVCALAAYGIHWLWEQFQNSPKTSPPSPAPKGGIYDSRLKPLLLLLCFFGLILFAVAGALVSAPETSASFLYNSSLLSSPEKPLYLARAGMMIESLLRTGFFLMASAGSIWWLLFTHTHFRLKTNPYARYAPFALVVIVMAFDLAQNARRYITFYDWKDRYQNNGVVNFLRKDPDLFRVQAFGIHESGLINALVSDILPYHGIGVVDPPAASRLPTEYEQLFAFRRAHYNQQERSFDLFNVKYILSSKPFADTDIPLEEIHKDQNLCIYRRKDFMPRAWLVQSAIVATSHQNALERTMDSKFPFRQSAVLEEKPEQALLLTTPPKRPLQPIPFKSYSINRLEWAVTTDQPSLLVIGEKWDSDWHAWVNDKPAKIFKVNFLMRGIELPAGTHQVKMEYRPSHAGHWISILSMLVVFLGAGMTWVLTRRAAAHPSASSQAVAPHS